MLQPTNTNTVGGNNNCNSNVGRGRGRSRGGFGSRGGQGDCRNNTSIVKSLFEEKFNNMCLCNLTITEELLSHTTQENP